MKKYFLLFILFFSIISTIEAQVILRKYRIYFKDKNHNNYSLDYPEEFLSERALERRTKQNIQLKEDDLPVSDYYLDSLRSLGATIENTSRWLNTAFISTTHKDFPDKLSSVKFIKSIQAIPLTNILNTKDKFGTLQNVPKNINDFDYGESGTQIFLHNGQLLHQQGFQGQGILIAVIDAGFYKANVLPAFDSLYSNNQVLATYDFVDGNSSVYEDHNHGMSVLSIIGGNIPGLLIGSAPKANFILLRSEDASIEYSVEEDNWAAAAEYADSAGADIINTSLGYTEFDDPTQSYTYSDMDGNTAFITKAADIAASKGMIVVVSAGNEGTTSWKYISAPADGDSVLAVGATDRYGSYVAFSSQGPTSDGRIKPNVVAMGYQTTVQDINGQVIVGSGTSYSAPIITGLTACLWQALPQLTNMEIIDLIEQNSNNYLNPDNYVGYGVPNFASAANISNINQIEYNQNISVFPNPFTDKLSVKLYSDDYKQKIKKIEIAGILGETVYQSNVFDNNYEITINNFESLPNGLYIITVTTNNFVKQIKVTKTN